MSYEGFLSWCLRYACTQQHVKQNLSCVARRIDDNRLVGFLLMDDWGHHAEPEPDEEDFDAVDAFVTHVLQQYVRTRCSASLSCNTPRPTFTFTVISRLLTRVYVKLLRSELAFRPDVPMPITSESRRMPAARDWVLGLSAKDFAVLVRRTSEAFLPSHLPWPLRRFSLHAAFVRFSRCLMEHSSSKENGRSRK